MKLKLKEIINSLEYYHKVSTVLDLQISNMRNKDRNLQLDF